MVKLVGSVAELQAEFKAAGGKAVLVDFFAEWCGPCKMIAPKLEEVSKTNNRIVVLKVDVDKADDLAQRYKVEAMPTFIFFQNGEEVDKMIGADFSKLSTLIAKYSE